MDKTYDPAALEQRWYARWEETGCFRPSGTGTPYCIVIPPPNVTGSLHMGHAFNNTVMDLLIRHARMSGRDTLWQVGTDHAGIATQMVVERQLGAQGQSRHELGREGFLKRVWEWKAQSGGTITRQLRRLGSSCDWSRERFTMDEGLSRAVTETFVRLHRQGLIYRGKRLVNWDPVLQTAISDLEVVSEEERGHLWHIRYPLTDGSGHLTVATTRPETLLGDAAVAVHPDDERYRHMIGKTVRLPLCEREIPVIADEYVDPAFGTGCVKITPAHDFNDYEVWLRHRQEPGFTWQPERGLINILTKDGHIKSLRTDDHDLSGSPANPPLEGAWTVDIIPRKYQGMSLADARREVVADLEAAGLLESLKDHTLMVPRGDRSGAVLEPYLTDQWYVDLTRETLPDGRPGGRAVITGPALEAVRTGRIRLIPEQWDKTYAQWLENIQDWCISRQIWWGHRIPAWYDPEGKVYVGRDEAEVRRANGLGPDVPLRQDEDVLDTWFSSALWPFSTLGWPDATPELARYYPTTVLVTGFDIIFFWVARMVMMGLAMRPGAGTGDAAHIPFRNVYVHGLVRDHEGQKMSKSKGNVLDPLDIIEGTTLEALLAKRTAGLMQPRMAKSIEQATRKQFPDGIPAYGTDALRFTFASQATLGRDIRFDLARCEGYRNFCTKLWNAARFVLMNTEGLPAAPSEPAFGPAENWVRARLADAVHAADAAIAEYRFDTYAGAVYDFVWGTYCDWYIELAKPVLQDPDANPARALGVRQTLIQVLETTLRLAHPLIPFITEEIWQQVAPRAGKAGDTIMRAPWPDHIDFMRDPDADADDGAAVDLLIATVRAVRNLRSELNLPPGRPVPLLLTADAAARAQLLRSEDALRRLARVERLEWIEPVGAPAAVAVALVAAGAGSTLAVRIPLAGLVDGAAETARLDREIGKLDQAIARCEAKLASPSFTDKAPAEVVAAERERLRTATDQRAALVSQRERFAVLG
jgi:valyl-tRNA synthetase